MNNKQPIALKTVLVLVGLLGLFLAADFGLGGFQTLGWQGSTDFLRITDAARYGVQDSNFRFANGMLAAIGAFLIMAATNPRQYQQGIKLVLVMIMVGGLTRFTAGDMDVLGKPDIIGALVVELGLMPVLLVWLSRTVRPTALADNGD